MATKRKRRPSPPPGSFGEAFHTRFAKIRADAEALGTNLTVLCKVAKVGRSSIIKWNHKTPYTIRMIDMMEGALKKLQEKAARERAAAAEKEEKD
jgi:hypothetical protein